jgi:hypothetical protein
MPPRQGCAPGATEVQSSRNLELVYTRIDEHDFLSPDATPNPPGRQGAGQSGPGKPAARRSRPPRRRQSSERRERLRDENSRKDHLPGVRVSSSAARIGCCSLARMRAPRARRCVAAATATIEIARAIIVTALSATAHRASPKDCISTTMGLPPSAAPAQLTVRWRLIPHWCNHARRGERDRPRANPHRATVTVRASEDAVAVDPARTAAPPGPTGPRGGKALRPSRAPSTS